MNTKAIHQNRRGAILIVALILAVLSGIAVASYLRLGKTSMELSNRSFYANAAVNLAETGLEQAMWSINQSIGGNATAYDGWTKSGNKASRTFTGDSYGQNTTGSVVVTIDRYNGAGGAPVLYSHSIITPPNGRPVEKWLRVDLIKRGRFINGLVAKNQVVFKGNNPTVDSWNSDPDKDPSNAPIPFSAAVRNDKGTVASTSIKVDSILVQNSDIWGYAATGQEDPKVGSNGSIMGKDTPAGVRIDPARISNDFTASFENEPTPSPDSTTGAITKGVTLNGGTGTKIQLPSITLNGKGDDLVIEGDVTLIVTGSIDITGNGGIILKEGAKLTIYCPGAIKIAGNGLLNNNVQPVTAMIYGTSTSNTRQPIDIAGNGVLKAVTYAPNADLKINGNGSVSGSFIAYDITMVGESNFHYDESLADLDTGNPYGILRWDELSTKPERDAAAAVMTLGH